MSNSRPFIAPPLFPRRKHAWQWVLPVLLILLFLFTLFWLPLQAQHMEANERQEQLIADTLWVEQTVRFQLSRNEESLRLVGSEMVSGRLSGKKWQDRLKTLLRNSRELSRVVWLDAAGNMLASTDDIPDSIGDFSMHYRQASVSARESKSPKYSPPAPPPGMKSPMMLDYLVPLFLKGRYVGSLIASYLTTSILDQMVPWWFAQDNDISLIDYDAQVIDTRAAGGPGRGVYTHRRALDLPGVSLALRTISVKSEPRLLPNLLVGSVIALSIGLVWSLCALWRDINRRLAAEEALRQQVALRSAMGKARRAGGRARGRGGRITYVNPAFCEMVGLPAEQLVGRSPPMPYWAPEAMEEYQERFSRVLAGYALPQFETIFQRADGERIPVLVFESSLLDASGWQFGCLC